jgi:dienelactone hydrolase
MLSVSVISAQMSAEEQGGRDQRAASLLDADHFKLRLSEPSTLQDWELRRARVRKKLMISTGLWPEPARTPLNAQVFGERTGQGFRVAKVYFESLPGFFVTGNLYRPESGDGPFPAVLTPHGHWKYGRLQNGPNGSIPARCIDFARMGFVVFSIDMVGYNDSFQLPHDGQKSRAQLKADQPLPYEPRAFRGEFDFPVARLYGLNLAGLHLWNGIRALDFLSTLPEVDPNRIGVTGASGGATQTILLMAADDRVRVAAPVNIIGTAKHPGCRCENPPGLWIETSTVELAATFAPRPLLLMSATGDPWTHSSPQREFPLIRKYFDLYDAADRLQNVHVDAGHNYNAETRAAVYQWFCQHLASSAPPIEKPVPVSKQVAALGDLRVFADGMLPESAITGRAVIRNWIEHSNQQTAASIPASESRLAEFIPSHAEALELVLSLVRPIPEELTYQTEIQEKRGEITYRREWIGSRGKAEWIALESAGKERESLGVILLVYSDPGAQLVDKSGSLPFPWMEAVLDRGFRIYHVRGFASGDLRIPRKIWNAYSWPDAYNRDNRLNGIQDILTALSAVRTAEPDLPLTVIGLGSQGLLTAFASAVDGEAEKVILDLDGSDPGYDREMLELLPVGSIERIGGFRTAFLLLLLKELSIFNAGPGFEATWYLERAERLGLADNLQLQAEQSVFNFQNLR